MSAETTSQRVARDRAASQDGRVSAPSSSVRSASPAVPSTRRAPTGQLARGQIPPATVAPAPWPGAAAAPAGASAGEVGGQSPEVRIVAQGRRADRAAT
ncbi:hypothetical protein GCM10023322_82040 [Rugosimonospora acidiphila]|uniref:Uncharacterized protein n=1 Tax=Rugosimonospora acidiphila TaxID=556531 RepID=A0ABP9SRW7_9ACTN